MSTITAQPAMSAAKPRRERAADYMVVAIPRAMPQVTVGAALADLAGHAYDSVHAIYLTGPDGRFLGVVPLSRLVASGMQRHLSELMDTHVPQVEADMDQEWVAATAHEHRLAEVPVVDADRHLLGVVPAQALLLIQRHEGIEDINRLVGIVRNGEQARDAIDGAIGKRVLNRLPWLLVGLFGSLLSAKIMGVFEYAIQTQMAIAFFVPAIVYLADAIGTQTEAIAVRGLSLSNMGLRRLLLGELSTGLAIGAILALLFVPAAWWMFDDLRLAMAVSLSLVLAGGIATVVGLLFPWLLSRLGRDPAFGSGPVATIVQDVLSLLIYFVVVDVLVL